ncbi:serine/threonine-protein kinase 33 isoform X2 [Sphaeramia orbicularis]|uniref:serine/threonine-protein kinase 33 isoform X2 n=1 Tax=Sphaeramia orbicularis TaxID=375764 RepID=UPI0011804748|nr:serine/threonine-protein kinase 33 isoform X2 [Sphaeramia orbicularis]
MNQQTGKNTFERNVPYTRLDNDNDLRGIYVFGKKLGKGTFGVVYEATHIETQTEWAIKEICRPEPGNSQFKMLDQEMNILKQVNHAHIIHLKEIFESAKMTYLVFELCAGGELKQLLRRKKFLTEDDTRHIIRCLADAIVYLHRRDIVHRDLKLENILLKNPLDDGHNDEIIIKVTDFGLSVKTDGVGIENIMTEVCGTLTYMAPEMMSGRGYTEWCDVWSIGVIMYMLLCGKAPFVASTKEKLLEKIRNEGVTFSQPVWDTVSDTAKKVLTCLLKVDPAYRMSANQLLENPWITGDMTLPVTPSNVLDMMRHYLEEEDDTQADDMLVLPLVPSESSTDRKCRSLTKFSSRGDSSQRGTPSSSQSEGVFGVCLQDQHKNDTESKRLPQATNTKFPCGVTPSMQPSARQCRLQDKKNTSTVKKSASIPGEGAQRRLSKGM